ncbi:hypothetical protein [Sporosarcina sp. G11-34]|nr:hypothetical protein [Sporosarcina sp. G11-34]MCZ2258754.1 hypothetical protein [Sporosarcina sp. G11-34]
METREKSEHYGDLGGHLRKESTSHPIEWTLSWIKWALQRFERTSAKA